MTMGTAATQLTPNREAWRDRDFGYDADDEDTSYPSPERELLWRLEDLQSRLRGLAEGGAGISCYRSSTGLCDDDIHYAPPGYLTSVEDVARAIEMAKRDLAGYGIVRFPA